jgi:hypothetical protein
MIVDRYGITGMVSVQILGIFDHIKEIKEILEEELYPVGEDGKYQDHDELNFENIEIYGNGENPMIKFIFSDIVGNVYNYELELSSVLKNN